MILINDVECHTQREVVLEHLKTYDICNMNQKGKNRFGNNTNFVKYKLNG